MCHCHCLVQETCSSGTSSSTMAEKRKPVVLRQPSHSNISSRSFRPLCLLRVRHDFHLACQPTCADHWCAFSTPLCPTTRRARRLPYFGFHGLALIIRCLRPHPDERQPCTHPTMDQVRCCSFPAYKGLLQFIVHHSRSFACSWFLPSVGHRGDPVNLRDTHHMQDYFLHSYNIICQLFMTCPHSIVASAMEAFSGACFLHWTAHLPH